MLDFKIDGGSRDFIDRVMRENLWTLSFTLRVIEEYKRFLYLASISPVVPSHEIDQVWHTHLLFSKDYEEVCKKLGKFIHHNPTPSVERGKVDNYSLTTTLYLRVFGEEVPKDIWTPFHPSKYVYVDLYQHWIIPAGDWRLLITVFFKYLKIRLWDCSIFSAKEGKRGGEKGKKEKG